MRKAVAAALAIIGLLCGGSAAGEEVDLELVLLADASGSIDDAEIRFQRQGYATAITDKEVLAAITGGYYRRIAVTYVEWGNEMSQEVVVPWTVIDGQATAENFAKALLERPRLAVGMNAIGSALAAGHALIEGNTIKGIRRVIDFSGDSANNFGGIPITQARDAAVRDDIVINGLAILCSGCSGQPVSYDLEAAFEELIIGGPGSFVVTAEKNDQFAEAVRKKLILEIADRWVPRTPFRLPLAADRR